MNCHENYYRRRDMTFTSLRIIPLIIACLAIVPAVSFAHHSVAGFFDEEKKSEIEGVVKKVQWRNPHTIFEVDVTSDAGEVVTWRIESGALGVLRSRGLAQEFMQPGERVKIMGDSSIRSDNEMFARHILLPNGKEVILTAGAGAVPYFTAESEADLLEAVYDEDVIAAARENADSIFRVWSTDINDRTSDRRKMFNGDYPLLPEAATVRANYDSGAQALLGCTEWSMPRIMSNPLPMEFVRDGENIQQRFEEDDNVRTIYMNGDTSGTSVEPSALGYSMGRWAGETLIVETSQLIPDRLDNHGTPFSAELHLTEHYTLSDNGNRLDYVLTMSDAKTLLEPVERPRRWDWRPEIVVSAYNCEQDQQLE
jgi:hypothetical protein